VRTKLDELKRQEVNRLRTLIKVKQDMNGEKGSTGMSLQARLFLLLSCSISRNVLHRLLSVFTAGRLGELRYEKI